MQSKNSFIAGLFVMSLCGFVVGAADTYEYVNYRLNGQDATMVLADPDKKVIQYDDVLTTRVLDVKYVSDAGEQIVNNKVLPKTVADRLVNGDGVAVTYLTNNPHRIFGPYPAPKIPWAWLVVGIVSLVVALFALRLRKREAAG